jgi:hypothetical protein
MISALIKLGGYFIAAIFFVLLLMERQCSTPVHQSLKEQPTMAPKIIKIHDTTFREVAVYYPKEVDAVIDTLAVVKDYLAGRVYDDTVHNKEHTIKVVIHDTITKNHLLGREVEIITVPELQTPKTKLFAGVFLGCSHDLKPGAGISLALINKKDQLYSASFDAVNRTGYLSMFWKIHFGK